MSGEQTETAMREGKREKGSPLLEMFSIFLRQDYHFPLLEVFAFLFLTSILLVSSLQGGYNETYIAYSYFGVALSLPVLVFMILVWKNISFGLGGDLEKGVMQTFLTYPLGRLKMLGARLLSSVGVALGILSLAELSVLLIAMPAFAVRQASTLVLNYLAVLALPVLITMVVLLVTVLAKNSGLPLAAGLVFYFVAGLFLQFFVGYATQTENSALLAATYLLNPALAFQNYYNFFFNGPPVQSGVISIPPSTWGVPDFGTAAAYLVGNYLVSLVLLLLSTLWFTRRLEV